MPQDLLRLFGVRKVKSKGNRFQLLLEAEDPQPGWRGRDQSITWSLVSAARTQRRMIKMAYLIGVLVMLTLTFGAESAYAQAGFRMSPMEFNIVSAHVDTDF